MKRILFIGNSLTYYNNLPAMVQDMADAAKEPAYTRMLAYAGYTLLRHTDPEDPHFDEARRIILGEPWDIIVLQDGAKTPVVGPDRMDKGFAGLMPYIRQAGAKPVFYKTWPYREGCVTLNELGVSYREMLEILNRCYEKQMALYEAPGVPVGEESARVQEKYPYLTLYLPDCIHPNKAGTYLAACLFYRTLFEKDAPPAKIWCPAGLDERIAEMLWKETAGRPV